MKKIRILLILSLILPSLYANPFAVYADPDSWIPNRVAIGLGNDKWAIGGISYNMDDQLSYSQSLYIQAPVWELTVDTDGITNRGWQNGWDVRDKAAIGDGVKIHGRYDETDITLALPLHIYNSDSFWLWTRPYGGLTLAGNMGFDFIQNKTHEILHKQLVNLPYETDKIYAYGNIGAELEAGFSFFKFQRSWLFASARGNYRKVFGYGEQIEAMGVLGITGEYSDIISIGLGYSWNKAETGWSTQEIYYKYLDGLTLSLVIDTGALKLDYSTSLTSEFGYGIISFDTLSFFRKSSWKKSDIKFAMGISNQLNATFYTTDIYVPIADTNYEIYLNSRFLSGDPSIPGWENFLDPSDWPRYKRSYNSLFLGVKYDFELAKELPFATPYAKLGLGMTRWDIRELHNMMDHDFNNPAAGLPNKIHTVIHPKKYSFGLDFELGFAFIPEGALKTGNTTFQLVLATGVTAIHNSKAVQEYLDTYSADSGKISTFIPRWGISIQMGFDI